MLAFILFVLSILLLGYFLSVLKRAALHFAYFAVGSLTLFGLLFYYTAPIVSKPLTAGLLISCKALLSSLGITYEAAHALLYVPTDQGTLSLYINLECSGMIEMFVLLSLLWFFPVYRTVQKLMLSLFGLICIFISNVLRLCILCWILARWGMTYYFIAHSIISRMLFYLLCILLYFFLFTRAQILRQKVGRFSYDND